MAHPPVSSGMIRVIWLPVTGAGLTALRLAGIDWSKPAPGKVTQQEEQASEKREEV